MNIQNESVLFFFSPITIPRIMNAKKTRNSRGKTRAMETHFYTMHFFFLSLHFSYEHAENFQTILRCPVPISRIMNAKKKLEMRVGTIVNVKPCFALLNLCMLALIATLSSSQHTLAL